MKNYGVEGEASVFNNAFRPKIMIRYANQHTGLEKYLKAVLRIIKSVCECVEGKFVRKM